MRRSSSPTRTSAGATPRSGRDGAASCRRPRFDQRHPVNGARSRAKSCTTATSSASATPRTVRGVLTISGAASSGGVGFPIGPTLRLAAVSEQLLTILKLCLLALLYLFFLRVLRAVWAEMKGAEAAKAGGTGAPGALARTLAGWPRKCDRCRELSSWSRPDQRGPHLSRSATSSRWPGRRLPGHARRHLRLPAPRTRLQPRRPALRRGSRVDQRHLPQPARRSQGPMVMQRGDKLQVGNTVMELV